jgi:hypothetical protein
MPRSFLASLFIAAFVFAIAIGVLLTMPVANVGRNATPIGLLVFALALSGWQLAFMTTGAQVAVATMMAHLFFVFFLIVPGVFQLATQTYALDISVYSPAIATDAAAIVLLFVVFFMAGGALGPKHLDPALRTIYSCEQRRRSIIVIAFVIIAAVVTLAAIIGLGLDTLVANRASVYGRVEEEETTATLGLFLEMPRAISFCGVLAVLYLFGRRGGPAGSRRNSAVLLGLIIFPLYGVVNFPLGLPRFWLFGMMIVLFLLYCDLRRPRNRLLLVAGIGGGAYTFFPLFRRISTADELDPPPELASVGQELVTSNFDGFEMIMNIVIVVERFGHTFGHQIASALMFFVPRSLWEGKALPSGAYTAEMLGYAFTNLSAPAPGELYLEFSYVGVVLGALAIGYIYRKADTLYAASLAFGGVSLHRIQAAMLAGFTIILMRGSLLAIISTIFTSFAAIWILTAGPKLLGILLRRA